MKRSELSVKEICGLLASTLDDLVNDRRGVDHANAVSNAAGKYLKTFDVRMNYQRMRGTKRSISGIEEDGE